MNNKYKENLTVGQMFKSYRQVCEALGEKFKAGDSKKSQIKEWERHFKYSKDGNKFIIDEIYDIPLPKIENRGGANNNQVGNLLSLILVNALYNEENNNLKLTLSKLYRKFNMINDNYNEYKNNNNELAKYLDIDEDIIKEFYSLNQNNFKRSIENVLNTLQKERIIIYDKVTYIKCTDEDIHRPATEQEKVTIMYIEKLLLNKYEYESYPEVFYSKDYDNFKYDNKKLMKEFGIEYYYFVYDITINKLFIGDKLAELIVSNESFFDKRKELNETLVKKLNDNAVSRNINALASKNKSYTNYLRTKDDYLKDYANLINTLIHDKAKVIRKEDINKKVKEKEEINRNTKENLDEDLFDIM